MHEWKSFDRRNNSLCPPETLVWLQSWALTSKAQNVSVKWNRMKIKVFTNSLFFYCFLWPFKCQNRFPWSVLCKYWWHNFKTSILLWKINFTSDFSAGSRKWRQNYDLSIFQVLRTGAFLWPEINILGRYMGCFDLIFVSERLG